MLDNSEIQSTLNHFGLSFQSGTKLYDTSHSEDDKQLNYILDDRYVLKVNSVGTMCEQRLQEISRLIARCRSIGVYCPALIPTMAGPLSYTWEKEGKEHTCYVEEYAIYPLFEWGQEHDRREVVEHLGIRRRNIPGWICRKPSPCGVSLTWHLWMWISTKNRKTPTRWLLRFGKPDILT